MKTKLTVSVMGALLVLSTTANAGVEDFHSMITESQKSKTELNQKLRKNVEIVREGLEEANWNSRQKIVIRDETTDTEHIAVPSNPFAKHNRKNSRASARLDQRAMDRLSQEVQEAE